jgi:hypothetical protein
MHLNKSEFLITLILKNLSKQCDFMVIFQISSNSINYGRCPFNDKWLKAILLIEICIHILFHGLNWKPAFPTFNIILNLLLVYVINDIFKLFQRKDFRLTILRSKVLLHGLYNILLRIHNWACLLINWC